MKYLQKLTPSDDLFYCLLYLYGHACDQCADSQGFDETRRTPRAMREITTTEVHVVNLSAITESSVMSNAVIDLDFSSKSFSLHGRILGLVWQYWPLRVKIGMPF